MPEDDALAHAVQQALASINNLPWAVRSRLLRQMARAIRAHAYPNPSPDDFVAWAENELADMLSDEEIGLRYRITLLELFANELMGWLSGNFDDVA